MNTVEKINYQIDNTTAQIVKDTSLKISKLNNNKNYRHFVFNIEEISNLQEKALEVIDSKTMWVSNKAYKDASTLVDSKSLTTKVTFLISEGLDLETLFSNLGFTIKELLIENEDHNQFCFSISVKNTKVDIADIARYLEEQQFLNLNIFYVADENIVTFYN